MSNLDRIRHILPSHTDLDVITEATTLADLELDSLDVVELVIDIEDEFDIELMEQASDFDTIGEIADAVATQLEKKNG